MRSPAPSGSPPNGGTSAASARSFRRRPRSRCSSALGLRPAARPQRAKALPMSSTRRAGAGCRARRAARRRAARRARCAIRRRPAKAGSSARTARFSSGASTPGTVRNGLCPTGARSSSDRSPCPPCRSAATASPSTASTCELTVAPPEAYSPEAARRKRFGVTAQLYALRRAGRSGHRRFLDARPRRRGGGRRGRGLFRRQPDAHAVPARPRAGEPLSSVRPALPRSDPHRRSRPRRCRATRHRRGARRRSGPRSLRPRPRSWSTTRRSGRQAHRARGLPRRLCARRAARPRDPLVEDYDAFVSGRGRRAPALRRLRGDRREARAAQTGARGRRRCATPRPRSRRRSPREFGPSTSRSSASGSPTGSSGAPPRAHARRARDRPLSRSRGRRGARRRGGLGARGRTRAGRRRRRAARSVLDRGPELEPAAAEPARGRSQRLGGWA